MPDSWQMCPARPERKIGSTIGSQPVIDMHHSRLNWVIYDQGHLYLSHIETENEVERKVVLIRVCKHTEPLKGLFRIFVIGKYHPVDEGDEAVEEAVGDEGLPDALVDAACPEEQDSVEAKARGLEVVEVCYSHYATSGSRGLKDPCNLSPAS